MHKEITFDANGNRVSVEYTGDAPSNTDTDGLARARRNWRNELLTACDWTQAADSPLDLLKKQEWSAYRAALRGVTDQAGWPTSVTWPEKPE